MRPPAALPRVAAGVVLGTSRTRRPWGSVLPPPGAGGAGGRRPGPRGRAAVPFQVLVLLLLSVPQALGSRAELDIPLSSPVSSLLFYLTSLALLALHVTVCTSAGHACYFCSLPWPAAGAVMLLVAALLCAAASALAKTCLDGTRPRKVRLVPSGATPPLVGCLRWQGDGGEGHTVGASARGCCVTPAVPAVPEAGTCCSYRISLPAGAEVSRGPAVVWGPAHACCLSAAP